MYNSQASLYRLGLANYSPQANWSEAWFFKNFTFLNSYISTYIIVLILPLCPLSLKYRIPGRWRKFADSWYRYQKTIRIMCCFCNLGKVSGCGQNWWACTGTLSHVDRSEWLLRRMWVFAHFGRSQWMWVKFTKKFFSLCADIIGYHSFQLRELECPGHTVLRQMQVHGTQAIKSPSLGNLGMTTKQGSSGLHLNSH